MARYRFSTTPGILAILARHGPTSLNETNTVRAWEDPPLESEGIMAAQMLARKLEKYDPKGVWSSDLTRDHQTADEIAKYFNIPHTPDFDLRTWDIGDLSGKPESEAEPAIQALYRQSWVTPPGSTENFDQFVERFLEFMERKFLLCCIDEMRPQVFVTHGRDCAVMDTYLNGDYGIDMTQAQMPVPAGFGIITVQDDRSLTFDYKTPTESITS